MDFSNEYIFLYILTATYYIIQNMPMYIENVITSTIKVLPSAAFILFFRYLEICQKANIKSVALECLKVSKN